MSRRGADLRVPSDGHVAHGRCCCAHSIDTAGTIGWMATWGVIRDDGLDRLRRVALAVVYELPIVSLKCLAGWPIIVHEILKIIIIRV
jgi:hypothetical protein